MILTWSERCVLIDITTKAGRNANSNADPPTQARGKIDAPSNVTFKITDTKLYVPVVTLSTEIDNKLLKQLKQYLKELLNGINMRQK